MFVIQVGKDSKITTNSDVFQKVKSSQAQRKTPNFFPSCNFSLFNFLIEAILLLKCIEKLEFLKVHYLD